MFASIAKQALEATRRAGPDPLVQAAQASVPQPPPSPVSWLCGLDLGMMHDPTALAIVRKTVEAKGGKRINRYAVLHLQRWLGVAYPDIAEELRPMLAALTPRPTLVADETGVGVGVLQILRKAKLPVAGIKGICITAGHRTTFRPEGGWNVPKGELVAYGQSALQGKRLDICPALRDAKVLRKELATFTVKINVASATESYEAWRQGDHDDLVLAVCMAVWFGENGGKRLSADHFFLPQP
jgi:hypothetical protein